LRPFRRALFFALANPRMCPAFSHPRQQNDENLTLPETYADRSVTAATRPGNEAASPLPHDADVDEYAISLTRK
jgi:hypothetical protein